MVSFFAPHQHAHLSCLAHLSGYASAMHDLEPVFHEATYTPRAAAICKSLDFERPTLVQSMYIFKVSIGATVVLSFPYRQTVRRLTQLCSNHS